MDGLLGYSDDPFAHMKRKPVMQAYTFHECSPNRSWYINSLC